MDVAAHRTPAPPARRNPRRGRSTAVLTGLIAWTVVLGGAGAPAYAATELPFPNITGAGALLWIAGLALFLALLWFVPILYDTQQANKWRAERQAALIEEMVREASKGRQGLTVEEVRQLVSAMDRPPRGTQGLTSSLLALLIVFLVGIALLASLLSQGSDSGDLRKTIITSLLAVLATISGFYFGARTAQTSTEQATKPPESRPAADGRSPRTGGGGETRGTSGEAGESAPDAADQAGGEPPDQASASDAPDQASASDAPDQASASDASDQASASDDGGTTGSSRTPLPPDVPGAI